MTNASRYKIELVLKQKRFRLQEEFIFLQSFCFESVAAVYWALCNIY